MSTALLVTFISAILLVALGLVAATLFLVTKIAGRLAAPVVEKDEGPLVPEDPRITWRTAKHIRTDLDGFLTGVTTKHKLEKAVVDLVEIVERDGKKIVLLGFSAKNASVRFFAVPPIARQLQDGLHARLAQKGQLPEPESRPEYDTVSARDLGELGAFAVTPEWTLYARSQSNLALCAELDLGLDGVRDLRDRLAATVGKMSVADLREGIVKIHLPMRPTGVMIPAKQAEMFYATHKRLVPARGAFANPLESETTRSTGATCG